MATIIATFLAKMIRRKDAGGDVLSTKLRRCLTTLDVAFFGVGNMLGSGIYILLPFIAHSVTGPAIVISYLLAGVASLVVALAYAEFGVRFPRAGSAFSYTYYSLGELPAFLVGWNLIMYGIICLSVVGKSCSSYIDSLSNGYIRNLCLTYFGAMEGEYLSFYPDVLAALIIVTFVSFMLLGVKETSWLNNTLVVVNIIIVIIICSVGGYHADIRNWEYQPADPKPDGFINGFLPYGWRGVFKASAVCYFAYVGFDCINSAGEEAKNPREAIPIATFITMFIVSTVYLGMSAVLTLMIPYYKIDIISGIPDALDYYGAHWAKYIVSVGFIAGMVTVIMGTTFACSRVMYAMAEDGLLPSLFSKTFRKVPFVSMITATLAACVIAVLLNVDMLIEMLSIGTLFSYLLVVYGLLVMRHSPSVNDQFQKKIKPNQMAVSLKTWATPLRCLYPSKVPQKTIVAYVLAIILALVYCLGFSINFLLPSGTQFVINEVICVSIIIAILYIVPLRDLYDDSSYKMPLAPVLPVLGMVLNAFLMTTLEAVTWILFLGWICLGFVAYFFHGMWHSKLNAKM